MASEYWPRIWVENGDELLRLARQQSYLCTIAGDGSIACKACGHYVPWEPLDLHFARHMAELDRYLASKRAEKRDNTAEGFYPKPCECGAQIPRTGKPGRPPTKCEKCAYPNAEAILAELGL